MNNIKLKKTISILCFVAMFSVVLISFGQTVEAAPVSYPSQIMTLAKAKKIIEAAEVKAFEIKVPMVITVVDGGGNLVAQHRMDNALLASIAISKDKAYTAVALKMPTAQAATVAQPGTPLFGINTTDGSRIVIFGGGIPIIEKGVVVGAIGVSGGSVEEDISVAEAGLANW